MALPIKNGKITTGYHVPGKHWSVGYHTGIDFATPVGTDILAVADGVYSNSNWGKAYGKAIVQALPDGTYVIYAHLSKVLIKPGDKIKKGQHIAESGNTGNSTGPHLHLERRNGPRWSKSADMDPMPLVNS
jgi:murein DD-endopeptidase MepM/ murein hydrolase activator NlpD